MEPAEKFSAALLIFRKSVFGFEKLMSQKILDFEPVITDGLKNGCIQKFEYSTELGWKLIRLYLKINGTEISSPKPVIKSFFENGFIDELMCEQLFNAIDDRNLLSHVYNELFFEGIFKRLPEHLQALKKLEGVLSGIKI